MADIDQLAQNFKSLKELRQYCNSQYQVIVSLNKKIVTLEEENKHLQKVLSQSTPLISTENGVVEVYKNMTDELAVCLMQIKLLKDKCRGGIEELTFEDAKKLDIYTKLLVQINAGKKKNEDDPAKPLTAEELLDVLQQEEKATKQNG